MSHIPFLCQGQDHMKPYLDILEYFAFPHLEEDKVEMSQQLGALPHYSNNVHDAPTKTFLEY
jgi:hypothetical protein